jgi:putative ABC transport system permease protein
MVKLLTGIFDPPPEALVVPWRYLAITGIVATTAVAAAAIGSIAGSESEVVDRLRSER